MKDVKITLERAFKTCYHANKVTKSKTIKHDMQQRMDEIYLIYSDIYEVSVIEAKNHLEKIAKEMMEKEINEYSSY